MNSRQTDIRMARVNNVDLAYQCFGDSAQPVLLLVMGLGAQMQTWPEGFCQRLAEQGYYVIRFDNRDCGQSSSLDNAGLPDIGALMRGDSPTMPLPYGLDDMADDAFALLDYLQIKRAHVAGASMGGMIIQHMSLRQPDRLISLMPIMTTSGAPSLPLPTPTAQAVLLTPAPVPLHEHTFVPFCVQGWRVLCGADLPFEEPRIHELAQSTFRRGYNPAGIARQFAAILMDGDRTHRLGAIKTPTLVIHGSADPLILPQAGQAVANAIPGAQFELIDGMGHDIPQARWESIVGKMRAFMAKAQGTSP